MGCFDRVKSVLKHVRKDSASGFTTICRVARRWTLHFWCSHLIVANRSGRDRSKNFTTELTALG